jgi:hypothetical protein
MRKNVQGRINLQVVTSRRLDPEFIKLFGITDAEAATLNERLAETKSRLDQLSIDAATSRLDSENNRFIVHVPPLPAEGGQVRDQLLQSFADVLGPERFDAMNALAGQAFDGAFSQFGLADTTYEINLAPTTSDDGQSIYQIKETNTFPENSYSTGNSTLNASSIPDTFPVLSHFIPPNTLGAPK